MYLHISVRSTGRESTKLQQLNEHSIQGPRHETTLTPKPCATESRDLINISSQIVHSAASRPKQESLPRIEVFREGKWQNDSSSSIT